MATKNPFLTEQIITYMGNKRKLLTTIGDTIDNIKTKLNIQNLSIGDGFSGSGVVSRLFKTKATKLLSNDIAGYSFSLNNCYLATPSSSDITKIKKYIDTANSLADNFEQNIPEPWISKHWAPQQNTVSEKDRAYFTRENGRRIDIIRDFITTIPKKYQPYLLSPLLVEASIHNNTNGQFSAFYKDGSVGAFGGKKSVDTKRITQPIRLPYPIFNSNKCTVHSTCSDTNDWVKTFANTDPLDIVYYDPPYNKHPYNIYYFLLDIINNWDKTIDIPDTNRGQPLNWTKSPFNSSVHAKNALNNLIDNTNAQFIVLSYNDGGIIPIPQLDDLLNSISKNVDKIPINHKTYNRLKGISNYKREKEYKDVKEFLYVIQK